MRVCSRFASLAVTLLLGGLLLTSPSAVAQDLTPRFGVGFNTLLSTADGFGLGFRGRVSAPVNVDLSLAVDVGFTGFVLGGRRDATYVFDPEVSAIVNLPAFRYSLTYLLFGLGAYVPVSSEGNARGGPTIHLGLGRVVTLAETSLFYEVDPALIIAESRVDLAIPLRIGLIF